MAGASTVIAVDRSVARQALSERMGATHFLGASVTDPVEPVKDLTAGRGADYVFECVGSEATLRLSLDALRPGGQLVILGKTQVNQEVRLRFGSLMGDKKIVRSSYGGASPRRDFPWLAQSYLEGELLLDELITTRLALEVINLGFEAMNQGKVIRAVVEFAD